MAYFKYKGTVEASKSIMNRLAIIQAFNPAIKIKGESHCDDVVQLKKALSDFSSGKSIFDIGAAGTSLRFLAYFLSKQKGEWEIGGTSRLFSRPQQELVASLQQLGVEASLSDSALHIKSSGKWIYEGSLLVDRSISSQFLSGIALSSWELEKDLRLEWDNDVVSDSYFKITLRLLEYFGMKFHIGDNHLELYAGQAPEANSIEAEPDMSSSFALATFAGLNGELLIEDFPAESLQPDVRFIEILENMGAKISMNGSTLSVASSNKLLPIEVNLLDCPDLFPVLAVLATKANGQSKLYGARQLIFKESNRIQKISELLSKLEIQHNIRSDGMDIFGSNITHDKAISFDCDEDHRLVFAAYLAIHMGYNLEVKGTQFVNKSFPGFVQLYHSSVS
ncbi:MAG: 3-phosphoshikimate 1-carboxyvinyltransferase [Bdellovibrionales bacterium]